MGIRFLFCSQGIANLDTLMIRIPFFSIFLV